jgi:K+-sensing histidine kinase KdpD
MVIEMMFRVAVIMAALWTGKWNAVKAAIAASA